MKPFGLSLLAAIVGYLVGLFGGMFLVETFHRMSMIGRWRRL